MALSPVVDPKPVSKLPVTCSATYYYVPHVSFGFIVTVDCACVVALGMTRSGVCGKGGPLKATRMIAKS